MLYRIFFLICLNMQLLSFPNECICNDSYKNIWVQKLIYMIHYLGSRNPYEGEDFVTYKQRNNFHVLVFKPIILEPYQVFSLECPKGLADCYLISKNDNDFTTVAVFNFIREDWQAKMEASKKYIRSIRICSLVELQETELYYTKTFTKQGLLHGISERFTNYWS